jgi:hypothetical protein
MAAMKRRVPFMINRRRAAYFAAILSVLACWAVVEPDQARAEVVQLMTGENSFGQGWLFLDFDGVCKVATAGHVIEGLGGGIAHPLIRTERRQEAMAGSALVLSKDPDVAVLSVPDTNLCGAGRLSAIGIERRIREMPRLELRRVDSKSREVRPVPVQLVASSLDADGGRMFAVRPSADDDRVVQGWSGAPIVDDKGLLGIVVEAGPGNTALAIRADVIRTVLDKAARLPLAGARAVAPGAGISVLAGTTDDPLHGPDQSLKADGVGWVVAPRRGLVEFSINYPSPVQVHSVTIVFRDGDASQVTGLSVSTTSEATGDDWIDVNVCRPRLPKAGTVTCPLSPRTVARARLGVMVVGDRPVIIEKVIVD